MTNLLQNLKVKIYFCMKTLSVTQHLEFSLRIDSVWAQFIFTPSTHQNKYLFGCITEFILLCAHFFWQYLYEEKNIGFPAVCTVCTLNSLELSSVFHGSYGFIDCRIKKIVHWFVEFLHHFQYFKNKEGRFDSCQTHTVYFKLEDILKTSFFVRLIDSD